MLTLKIYNDEEGIFENPDDAINYIKKTNFEKEISVYDIDSDKAYSKTRQIYDMVRDFNKGKPLNQQLLPTKPFGYRGILGCLGVQVYSISFGTYEKNRECIALFTGYNESVLDTSVERANIRPSLKALASMAMIGKMRR